MCVPTFPKRIMKTSILLLLNKKVCVQNFMNSVGPFPLVDTVSSSSMFPHCSFNLNSSLFQVHAHANFSVERADLQ